MRLSVSPGARASSGGCREDRVRRERCGRRCLRFELGGWRRVLCGETIDKSILSKLRDKSRTMITYHDDDDDRASMED